ncbi:MAG: xanthine dehydrogenase family protein molybdopterin-binding subunit [Elusimicrobiota bacterium]
MFQKTNENLSFIGKSINRVDSEIKIEGKALYGDDIDFANMLYGVCIRSPYPKTKIEKIDISEVEKDKDFVRLITAKDIPGKNNWQIVDADYPFLADEVAEFHGQAIGILVAKTYLKARELLKKVKILCKELDYIDDIHKSIKDKKNIFSSYVIKKGDAFSEIKKCKYVIEKEFTTNYQVHCYLEPQVATGVYKLDGSLVVYSSTQCPFYVLDAVCAITGLSSNRVKVIQTVTGGGFGGKEDVPALVGAHAALCSYIIGKPVRISYDREEDFRTMSKRHPSYSKITYAADEKGKLKCCIIKYILDAGAYSTLSPIVLWRGTVHASGPYQIENVFIESYAVKTNKVPCGAFRGFGQPQISFATESIIDDLADKIKMDPLEFRLKNIIDKNYFTATSQKIKESIGLKDLIKVVKKKSGWPKKLEPSSPYRKRAYGCSVAYYGVGLGAKGRYLDRAGAYINIYKDGSVNVSVGNTEMGQGALTVLTQITCEMLNAPVHKVRLEEVDTSKVPDSGPTVASRTTVMSGNAIIEAAKPLRKRIFKVASDILKSPNIIAKDGFFICEKGKISFEEVIKECWALKLKMSEQGWYVSPSTSYNINDGQGDAYIVYSYSANIADVEIDMETGEIDVKKIYSAFDVGKVINPVLAVGQAQGGILQGMSWGVYENLVIEKGIMKNPGFTDYLVATSSDMPEYDIEFVEKEYSKGPYKAKGLGELPLIAVSPAIRNAVKRACGIEINYIPFLPEKNLKLIKEKNAK